MKGWIVYSREGCGLCQDFMAELAGLMGDRASIVQIVDIDGNEELTRRYSDRIPVLAVDGDFVCSYRLDAERVARYLADELPGKPR